MSDIYDGILETIHDEGAPQEESSGSSFGRMLGGIFALGLGLYGIGAAIGAYNSTTNYRPIECADDFKDVYD